MIFCLYTDYGALNSKLIFEAFADSIIDAGHTVIYNEPYRFMGHYDNYDVAVIWSVLWDGRMSKNKDVWEQNRILNKPVIVLEVGGINRGTTWKVGLNGINRSAYFGEQNNDRTRADHLGLVCKPWRSNGDFILICGQHNKSLQWQDMPLMSNWFLDTYDEIRKHTDRPILFRPHPRCRLEHIERGLKNVHRQEPKQITGTYDVGNDIDFWHDIENPLMPDRTQWLNDYAWTEFTIEEISQGIPLKRLTSMLN